METVYVWILFIVINGAPGGKSEIYPSGGGAQIIDNIASQQECERLQQVIQKTARYHWSQCIQVEKLK